jgi:ribosomal protein S18 acetylase RimI-like enzyme
VRASYRRAVCSDLASLCEFEDRVFATDRITRPRWQRLLNSPRADILVAESKGSLIGCAVVLYLRGSRIARLYSIAVAPEVARNRIGTLLLAYAERAAFNLDQDVMRLEVRDTNAIAISFYRKNGYVQCGTNRGYYEDGGDALRLERDLTEAG